MKKIWIVGYGGIATALLERYSSTAEITVITRKQKEFAQPIVDCNWITIDKYNDENIKSLIDSNSLPNIIIVTTGNLYNDSHMPEKTIVNMQEQWLLDSVKSNVVPTLLFAKYITKHLSKKNTVKLISFSARVSSISDNRLGGWHSYRMTKTMLNMLIKNIAIEWNLKSPESIVIGYHPGTVATQLSQPFTKNTAKEKLFSKELAAKYCQNVIESLEQQHSGQLLDWQGLVVPS